MVTQLAQHAGEGLRGNPQLRRNQAFACAQGDAQTASVRMGPSMVQQPLCAARFGILRQPTYRQLGLRAIGFGQILEQMLGCLRQFSH